MLFAPLTLRGVTLRNRIMVSPMCQYSCEDGFATDWHLVHLGSRAVGGAGLVMVEATAVEARGRISPHDMGIWKDGHAPALERIARFVEGQGAVSGIQLAHAGRKASVAAPWRGGRPGGGIRRRMAACRPERNPLRARVACPPGAFPRRYRHGGGRLCRGRAARHGAGFKVVELHFAHGYLVHEFLSPLSNQRTDAYGGSFENRSRVAREIARAVRAQWPERLPLLARLSVLGLGARRVGHRRVRRALPRC